MKTISFLLLLGLVQAGLAQTAIVPVQPRKVVLPKPSTRFYAPVSRGIFTCSEDEPFYSIRGCRRELVVYSFDRRFSLRPVLTLHAWQMQLIAGQESVERRRISAPAKPFFPTLSQGRYAYH